MAANKAYTPLRMLSAERVAHDTFPPDSPVVLLHRHWLSLRPNAELLPGRQHLDPLELDRTIMPWVFILDVIREEAGSLDYHFRLVGTGNVQLVGRDATGQLASDVFGRVDAPFVLETFDLTVTGAAPTFWVATVPHDQFGDVTIHRGLLPMARDGRIVDMLLCIAAPWPPR